MYCANGSFVLEPLTLECCIHEPTTSNSSRINCDGLDLPVIGGIVGSSVTANNNDATLVLC